jgi:hypothetical protein
MTLLFSSTFKTESVRRAIDPLAGAGRLLKDRTRLRLPGGLFFVANEVLLYLLCLA